MKPIIFLHIPKTAGTSFRWGADSFFGKEKVCLDYGQASAVTSEIVRDRDCGVKDGWEFTREFDRQGYQFLTGHFHSTKYINLFSVGRMITFLRDPIQRVASEYNHCVRNYDYRNSFESFYRSPRNINRQLRLVGQKIWPEFGFIGFADRYRDSLYLLNRKFNIDIPYLHENVARERAVEPCQLTAEQQRELRSLNVEELEFYSRARDQFEWRLRLARASGGYVSGAVTGFEAGKLKGWAIAEDGDEVVLVQARIGDEVIAETRANEYRPHCKARGLGRGGFVVFSLEVAGGVDPSVVDCVVAGTGQPLLSSCSW